MTTEVKAEVKPEAKVEAQKAGGSGLEVVMLRNNFYRDNYRRVISALLLMILINFGLVGVVFYQISNVPTPQYFATGSDGRITPLYPLSMPVMSPGELVQWASRAAVAVYSYNFVDYREALQKAQNYFTPEGWSNFEDALKSSRTLDMVLDKKLVVSAVATGAPVILDQGLVNDRYAWKVQLPILVTYQSATENTQQPLVVTMVVSRVPTLNTPRGIAIASFVSGPGSSPAR
ncbi:MAG: type IVB secretion system apparatus protein IcmL/DotI [Gammaproteobacteria bacterium]